MGKQILSMPCITAVDGPDAPCSIAKVFQSY